jgi:uncharacterized repeat protein (TIGR03803 family)
MRRTLLLTLGIQLLLIGVWLALPPEVVAASSGKIIYTFAGGADGADPYSDLILDAAGNLYGTTIAGGTGCNNSDCGTVFELTRTKDGWKHQVLYSFAGGANDGYGPKAGLVFDSSGNLYGTTVEGGISNCYGGGCGTVFKLAPNSHGGWTESIVYKFTGINGDGANPKTDLVFDHQGNLYGTTWAGGNFTKGACDLGCGIVFKLTPNQDGTWTESIIHAFAGPSNDGSAPITPVVLDADGNIYGATRFGGTEKCVAAASNIGCGAVYKLTTSPGGSWSETLLYSFHRFQGTAVFPAGGFLLEPDGKIFGTSFFGGDRYGALFELQQTKKGWEQTVLHRFYGTPDGQYPVGRLAMGPNGNLYGATVNGVFEVELTKGAWKERVLFSFDGTPFGPAAGPIVDSQSRVYGTALSGYPYYGAVYEIIP